MEGQRAHACDRARFRSGCKRHPGHAGVTATVSSARARASRIGWPPRVERLHALREGVVDDESAPAVGGHAVVARILPETRDVTEDRQVAGLVLANRVASLPGGA